MIIIVAEQLGKLNSAEVSHALIVNEFSASNNLLEVEWELQK